MQNNNAANENYLQPEGYYYFEHSPIELLGYAKNNIVEVQELAKMPEELLNKMRLAYQLLNEVQEYLFDN